MVYQRKYKVKGQYIYYTLTSCKRDEHGNPIQEHITYLEKNPLNEDELKHYKELQRDLKPHEIKLTEIFHSIHKNKDGVIEYDIFVKKAKINGILKKFVDQYIELFADSKTLIKIQTNKNIKTNIDEETRFQIKKIAKEKGFETNTLEKVARLLIILKEISKDEETKSKIAFFGGTAINSIYNNYPRLSVDIDLQYIGSNKKEVMLKDREIINKKISNILKKHQYNFEEKSYYALNQFHINYIMDTNHQEKIKIEINYFDRVPILPLTTKNVKSPINESPFKILTLEKEELYAKKLQL